MKLGSASSLFPFPTVPNSKKEEPLADLQSGEFSLFLS